MAVGTDVAVAGTIVGAACDLGVGVGIGGGVRTGTGVGVGAGRPESLAVVCMSRLGKLPVLRTEWSQPYVARVFPIVCCQRYVGNVFAGATEPLRIHWNPTRVSANESLG